MVFAVWQIHIQLCLIEGQGGKMGTPFLQDERCSGPSVCRWSGVVPRRWFPPLESVSGRDCTPQECHLRREFTLDARHIFLAYSASGELLRDCSSAVRRQGDDHQPWSQAIKAIDGYEKNELSCAAIQETHVHSRKHLVNPKSSTRISMSELRLYRPDACTGCVGTRQKGNDEGYRQDERTMLPGLSTTINSRSLSCSKILTGVAVTGGSWRCTTFLHTISAQDQAIARAIHSLDPISVEEDCVWLRYLSIDCCNPGF